MLYTITRQQDGKSIDHKLFQKIGAATERYSMKERMSRNKAAAVVEKKEDDDEEIPEGLAAKLVNPDRNLQIGRPAGLVGKKKQYE